MSKITLEQWKMFAAVVDYGGFAQAAKAIHKSQSTINYAVNKLQDQLGVKLLEVVGRKAVLTETGTILLKRARPLLDDAEHIEKLADALAGGSETTVHLAIDAVFPQDLLFEVLDRFSAIHPFVRVELHEEALSGGLELLAMGKVDIAIAGPWRAENLKKPGESLLQIPMFPVAAADHELHQYGSNLNKTQLRQHRQVVIRDSGSVDIDAGWLGADQRWTVSSIQTSIQIIRKGLAYAWIPEPHIRPYLADGSVRVLAVEDEPIREAQMFLYQRPDHIAGECTETLLELLRALSQNYFNV